jgi:DNA-directed RNA polymerase subunit RPC12/RpoP
MARVPDNLTKYECHDCGKQFIVSDRAATNTIIWCPYCTSEETESIVWMDDKERLNELGCLGIYHDEE